MALWIVATPIGTLGDLSPRAQDTLRAADVIAAEDTRTTRRLLTAMGVESPELIALHAHNESRRAERLAQRALDEDVVLVSDAGTPVVSDPGELLLREAHRLGVTLRSVPGPSALAAALAVAGFSACPSSFVGFPPRKGRDSWCRQQLERADTLVVYESPRRVADLVRRLAAIQPEREACSCRELSKRYEEVIRRPLRQLHEELVDRDIRGECVLVVGPGVASRAGRRPTEHLSDDAPLKQVAAVLARRWGVSRKTVYNRLLVWEREGEPAD